MSREISRTELFVGNLSYFCEEEHLSILLHEYTNVKNVRIMRSRHDQRRSLLFGFVEIVGSIPEIVAVCRLLNGHLFMGRHLRVEPSTALASYNTSLCKESFTPFQIHLAISSFFTVS